MLKQFEVELIENKIYLTFKKNDECLHLTIKSANDGKIDYYTASRFWPAELKNIGFTLADTSAELKINQFDSSKIPEIIKIIARITYDVFMLYGNREAKIIINEIELIK